MNPIEDDFLLRGDGRASDVVGILTITGLQFAEQPRGVVRRLFWFVRRGFRRWHPVEFSGRIPDDVAREDMDRLNRAMLLVRRVGRAGED